MGAFDDLVPGSGTGAFDDLVPAKKKPGILDDIKNFATRLIDTENEGIDQRRRTDLLAGAERSNAAAQAAITRQSTGLNEAEAAQAAQAAQANARFQRSPANVLTNAAGAGVDLAQDLAVSGAKGVVGFGESAVGLADLATGWTGVTLGGVLKDVAGYDPEAAKKFLEGFNSDRGQADNAGLAKTKGFVDTLAELGGNPRLMAQQIFESLPGTIGAGAVGGVVANRFAAGFLKEATSKGLVGTAAQEYVAKALADNSARITKAVMLAAAGAEGAQSAGSIAESARQAGREWKDYVLPAIGAGVGTAAIGLGAGKLATKMGVGDIETDIALRGTGLSTGRTGPGSLPERLVVEGLKEGVLEEAPQSAQEAGFENVALGRPWDQGLGKATAQGLATGAGMGGGHAALSRAGEQIQGQPGSTPVAESQAPAPSGPGDGGVATTQAAAGPEPTAAEKALLEPRTLTALDRVNEIDQDLGTARNRLADLNDPAKGYGPMFDQERAELAGKQAELAAERESITKSWPAAVEGKPTDFSTEAGARVQAKYALMDVGDLQTSHDEDLRPNPVYPTELQPRERDRAASEMQISGIVQKLDPARLGLSADAANGAPIVGADGLVESGNARTIALKRIYQANGQKAADYKQFLKNNAGQFGLTPEQIDAMGKPVLVRVRTTPVNRAEFARQANASTVAMMSPSEQGKADANRIDSLEDLVPDDSGDFTNAASRPFIRRFMARLPVTEQAGMIDSAGNLSTTGYARVRNAVLAKAYGDSPVLMRMTESMDDNLRNVSRALMMAAPKVAQMREAVGAGNRFDADITPDLMAAVEELSRLKEAGTSVEDALAQAGMFGDKYSPETRELLQFLADNARRPRKMADFLVAYMAALDSLGDPNQGTLLGDTQAPAKADLMAAAKRETQDAAKTPTQDTQRGNPGQDAPAGRQAGDQPATALSRGRGNEGAGPAGSQAGQVGEGWALFGKDSGTLGIPRAAMPQIKGEQRGALVNFLEARGITHTNDTVPAKSLKPTQAEYSRTKVDKFKETGAIGERSVLVSSDGHVLDGHHQWLGMAELGQDIPVIRLGAPIVQLLDAVNEFPSVRRGEGGMTVRDQAVSDFKAALADLAQIATRHTRAAMIPEETPKLMDTLVRLFDAAIKIVGSDMKAALRYVKEQLRKDPENKRLVNVIKESTYQKAALQAIERQGQADPFADEAPTVAMIDGRPYDAKRDNYKAQDAADFVPADLLQAANDTIAEFFKGKPQTVISDADRAKAEAGLKPLMALAENDKAAFDQTIINVAQEYGIGQMLASIKKIGRAAEKVVDDYGGDVTQIGDLLRATIIVNSYGNAGQVIAALAKKLNVEKIKNKAGVDLSAIGPALLAITKNQDRATFGGYADVSMVVRTASGVLAEVQINVPEMMAVKDDQGHKLYEAARAQPKDSEKAKAIDIVMGQVYDVVFKAAMDLASNALPSAAALDTAGQVRRDSAADAKKPLGSVLKQMPPRGAPSRPGTSPVESSSVPSSESRNQAPSGNMTNSSPPNVGTKAQPSGNFSGTGVDISNTPENPILQRQSDSVNGEGDAQTTTASATSIAQEIGRANPNASVNELRADASRAITDQLGRRALEDMGRGSMMMGDELTRAIQDGQYAAIRDVGASMPVPVRESDIPRDIAERAYSGTSFSPERRADSAQRGYVRQMVSAWQQAERAAGNDKEALERVTEEMRKLVDGYRSRIISALVSHGRVASAMIVGPAKFPTASNTKKSEVADKRAQESSDFLSAGIARMLKAAKAPVDNTPESEVARIRANLVEREKAQAQMKAANAALRKNDDAALRALGFSDSTIEALKKPDFAGRTGFPSFKLSNNNAEISRLRERLEEAERRQVASTVEAVEDVRDGARIVEDAADNRLRVFFDGKPDEAVRTDLKANGFRWSPNAGAWQRPLTDNARRAARVLLDEHYPTNGAGDPEVTLSRGTGGGMDVNVLEAIAQRIKASMPNMPTVRVLRSPADAPKALREYIERQGAWNDVDGAMHKGELYLFASGLPDAMRAEHVLAEHEAAHFGLRAILGSSLNGAMQLIYNNNPSVRQAAKALQARGKLTNAQATEEVLVDIPSAQLARLTGWRKLVAKIRDGLAARGYEAMAAKLSAWLDGSMTEQQRADLFAADLVRAARGYVAGKVGGRYKVGSTGTRLSGTLAEDVARQEKWLTAEAKARGYKDIDELAEKDYPLFEKLAKLWRDRNPADMLLSRGAGVDGKTFELFDPKTGKVVGGPYQTVTRARLARDKKDMEYGAIRYRVREVESGENRLSRAPAPAAAPTAAQRAEAIIQTNAATAKPIDAVAKAVTRISGVDFVAGKVFDTAGDLLDLVLKKLPDGMGETLKAGFVSDYGVPETVIDQRAMMQGRQRVQLRQAGNLLDKLSTLTREESRVAYEWMNETDPKTIYRMMQNLPDESVKVLLEVQQMIDKLSKEAVRMGQLSPEAYEANKFAYLRRSYQKYTLDQTAVEKAGRARAISILGDQYRGRGLTEAASMKQIQNAAPEWWKRKMVDGKADVALKGEKFIRMERRAPNGAKTIPLAGMTGKQDGRLLEVQYHPVGAQLPARYADWNPAGTFQVRDVKGDKVVLWRDFTKDERERMGEIDEARFAIAKTLQGMIHDVEVGRYLEWLAHTQAKKEGETIPGQVVEASESYGHVFKPGEWVKVPDSKIAGTTVLKYGKLAGRYLPGPVWNDLRQVVGGQFRPFGETYGKILSMWKTAKTALSPAVHTNNIMSNLVMADWHDVTAGHTAKALRILLGAHGRDGKGALGRVGNVAAGALGAKDREAALEIMNRYLDSGGDIGSWATNEISQDQISPLLEQLERELASTNGGSAQAQVGIMAALQHALMLRFPSAWDAAKNSKPGQVVVGEGKALIGLYQAEDDVFRLAAWLKAKEEGRTDMEAGKIARRSFMDYSINAPWISALRNSALPFISYTYRAVPMMLETAGKKPHKLMKLMLLAGAVNALGVMIGGGGDDDERKLLPEEKAGRIWGLVPKLIRMPWNDANSSPVYLDIRRFIPVGDVLDIGQGHSAVPMLPAMTPGGPLVILGEVIANRSMFTGKPINLDTDTGMQATGKVIDHLWKAFAPNILGLPGTYATTGVGDAIKGKTDAFGREQSVAQAVASSFGVKLGSYPADVLRRNERAKAAAQVMEIDRNISALKRQLQTRKITAEDFQEQVRAENDKKRKVMQDLQEKVSP